MYVEHTVWRECFSNDWTERHFTIIALIYLYIMLSAHAINVAVNVHKLSVSVLPNWMVATTTRTTAKKLTVIRKKNLLLDFINWMTENRSFALISFAWTLTELWCVILVRLKRERKKEEKLYIFNTCLLSYVYFFRVFFLFKYKNRLSERRKIIKLISENVKFLQWQ